MNWLHVVEIALGTGGGVVLGIILLTLLAEIFN